MQPPRVPERNEEGTPDRAQTPPAGQYRSGGPGPGRHRPRHGCVLALRESRRVERQRHDRAHRSGPDQPDPRRGAGRTGGGV